MLKSEHSQTKSTCYTIGMQLYNSQYQATDSWPYAISAGCVVYRTKKNEVEVLLLKRNPGHANAPDSKDFTYMLPKGHVAIGEPIEAAAQRETEEEAGVKVVLQTYLGSQVHEFKHPRHLMKNRKTTHYFAGLWQNDMKPMDSEHDASEWMKLNEALEKLSQTTPERKEYEIVKRLEEFLELTHAA